MYQGTLAAGMILALTAGMALAEGDAAKGEKVFRKCKACHMVGDGAENRVGPVLTGVVGREIAAVEGFDYSDALKELAAADGTWTPEELAAFLEKPKDFAKGTKMSFAGLRKEDERADVIAYLATFGGEGS
ncbi:c-type cytochrome [Alloyangia pacifica]|uniref:Cytochrome c n=1 Tax=Alloyangia pacifica TaxID=311180 RepID=A0A1I6VF82_9RHOB|nr:cytochrome c family protein [Alloyangia pacifica]SDH94927.1 cytochrome c [Alloyangia pacifica]SFT12317.1 cytochrome c [Alloyangia pacifica]